MGDVVLLWSNSVGIDCLVFRDTTRCVEDCGCPLVAFSYTILLLDPFSALVIISASLCGLIGKVCLCRLIGSAKLLSVLMTKEIRAHRGIRDQSAYIDHYLNPLRNGDDYDELFFQLMPFEKSTPHSLFNIVKHENRLYQSFK